MPEAREDAAPLGVQNRTAFQARFDVSRETMAQIDAFAGLLERWQTKINLVGPKTIDEIWSRHIWDAAQIRNYIPSETTSIMDIGSGAGLPGVILAALTDALIHSVESDGRKIAFQRQVAMAMGLVEKVVLHNKRVETLPAIGADVITARAFAPLAKLFELSHTHAHDKTLWILPKGQNVALELEEATKCWTFHVKQVHSETDDQAKLLLIHSVRRSR